MKKLGFIIACISIIAAFTSCSKDEPGKDPGNALVRYMNNFTVVNDGPDGYILHSDGSPLYLQFSVPASPALKEIVESGSRRIYGMLAMPQSFDPRLIEATDTVLVHGATLLKMRAIDTHNILTATEAEALGVLSIDMSHELTRQTSAMACRGYITVSVLYNHDVDIEKAAVYMYIDEAHCSSDVLALRLIQTCPSGFDLTTNATKLHTDCFSLKSLKQRYGSTDKVKIELRNSKQVVTSFYIKGSDFTSPE